MEHHAQQAEQDQGGDQEGAEEGVAPAENVTGDLVRADRAQHALGQNSGWHGSLERRLECSRRSLSALAARPGSADRPADGLPAAPRDWQLPIQIGGQLSLIQFARHSVPSLLCIERFHTLRNAMRAFRSRERTVATGKPIASEISR